MKLYSNDLSGYPKVNAQQNLEGRTHYVDDDTLRYFRSRVLYARAIDNGLLFGIVTSDSLDYEHTRRGFRFVVFDLFGEVIERTPLENVYSSEAKARSAMWAYVNTLNAKRLTRLAIVRHLDRVRAEMKELRQKVRKL